MCMRYELFCSLALLYLKLPLGAILTPYLYFEQNVLRFPTALPT